jgi:hypothetical protein
MQIDGTDFLENKSAKLRPMILGQKIGIRASRGVGNLHLCFSQVMID